MTTNNPAQIVFIDSRVPDLQDLLGGLAPGEQAFVLDASSDGLQQIADILATNNLTDLSSIAIVSHGETGELELGSAFVTDGNLAGYSGALAKIGAALAPGGNIQLYGCDVALGSAGQQFIDDFSALTGGVQVEAATHIVGSSAFGGSWTLDASSGPDASALAGEPAPGGSVPLVGNGGVGAPLLRVEPGGSPTNSPTESAASSAPFTTDALANFQGQLASPPTAQLFYRINQSNDVQLGAINNIGSTATHNSIYFGGGFRAVRRRTSASTMATSSPSRSILRPASSSASASGTREATTPSASSTSGPGS